MERKQAEQQILEAVDLLFANQVMAHSGQANLSARIDEDIFLITTKGGIPNLTARNLALVDLNDAVI